MKPRHQRLAIAFGVLLAVGAVVALVLNAFRSNLVFFYSPTQVVAGEAPAHRAFRLGGLVREGSLMREGVLVRFVVTDTQRDVAVAYQGSLPDLFKEGKGVVAQGSMGPDGVFMAREVLAKHDENYMPPEAAEALKRAQGHAPEERRAAPSSSSPSGGGSLQRSGPGGPYSVPTLVEGAKQ